jgi:hypothetical protein
MKIHLISLNQDKLALQEQYTYSDSDDAIDYILGVDGEIKATEHLLSVATDIMNDNERVY